MRGGLRLGRRYKISAQAIASDSPQEKQHRPKGNAWQAPARCALPRTPDQNRKPFFESLRSLAVQIVGIRFSELAVSAAPHCVCVLFLLLSLLLLSGRFLGVTHRVAWF